MSSTQVLAADVTSKTTSGMSGAVWLAIGYLLIVCATSTLTRLLVVGGGGKAFFTFTSESLGEEETKTREGNEWDAAATEKGAENDPLPGSPSIRRRHSAVGRDLFRAPLLKGQKAPPPSPLPERLLALSPSDSSTPAEARMLRVLSEDCCALPVCGATTAVLYKPCDFYSTLCEQIACATESVTLCALYIGDGPLARRLIDTIAQRAHEVAREREAAAGEDGAAVRPPFTIRMVMDYHRMRDRNNMVTFSRLLELTEGGDDEEKEAKGSGAEPSMVPTSDAQDSEVGDAARRARLPPALRRHVAVEVYLYQHPSRWTRRLFAFGRMGEALGVQHAKIFSTDDANVILTGANLSDDYFTTRTDRYLVVRDNPHVGYWFNQAVRAICSVSHPVTTAAQAWRSEHQQGAAGRNGAQAPMPIVEEPRGMWRKLKFALFPPDAVRRATASAGSVPYALRHGKSGLLLLPNACGADPAVDTDKFTMRERQQLLSFAHRMRVHFQGMAERLLGSTPTTGGQEERELRYDTIIFPTLQCGPAGVFHDSAVVEALLRCMSAQDHLYLTSPYMNLYASYMHAVLEGAHQMDCITASITANGWNTVKGASFIPLCYLQLERVFYYLMRDWGCSSRVRVREFAQPGWTFHSKGVWFVGRNNNNNNNNNKQQQKEEVEKRHEKISTGEGVADPSLSSNPPPDPGANPGVPYLVGFGSSNYGYRSVHRDMEVAMLLYTTHTPLRQALWQDLVQLLEQSGPPVQEDAFVGQAMGRFQPVVSLMAQLGQGYL